MERFTKAAEYAVEALKRAGATDASCYITGEAMTEANTDAGDFSLLRTYDATRMDITAIDGDKTLTKRIVRTDKASIDEAVEACMQGLKTTFPDKYFSLPEDTSENISVTEGELECDTEGLLTRIREAMDEAAAKGDDGENDIINHVRRRCIYLNSRGVNMKSDQGFYKQGRGLCMPNMGQKLSEVGKFDYPFDKKLLKEPVSPIDGKFEGTLLIAPSFVRHIWWLSMFILFGDNSLGNDYNMARTPWADMVGQRIASESFSLYNNPRDPRFCGAPIFTGEGLRLNNSTLIENGILKALPISSRAAKKLSLPATMPPVDYDSDEIVPCNFVIPGGDKSVRDIVRGIDHGLVIFGMPGIVPHDDPQGIISSVARNAALIEHGEITRHVSELMVSGSYYEMYKNISAVSSETRLSGGDETPWIAFDGFTVQ